MLFFRDEEYAQRTGTAVAGYDTARSGLQYFIENAETLQIGTNRLHDLTITTGVSDEDSVGDCIFQVFFHIPGIGQDDGA